MTIMVSSINMGSPFFMCNNKSKRNIAAAPMPLTFINFNPRWLNLLSVPAGLVLLFTTPFGKKIFSDMKQLLIASATLLALPCLSQVNEGKILYERTVQLQIRINDDNPAFQNMIPKERKDRFELLFADGKSLWQPVEDNGQNEEMNFNDGGGVHMVIRVPGSDDITYHNIAEGKKV